MATISLNEPIYRRPSGPLFFAAGFRPFFLLAGLHGALMLPLWLAMYAGGLSLALPSPALWHAHEMVFGFAGAAIGGFLLTAVPSWSNTNPVQGKPLMLLVAAWLAGRVVFTLAGILPPVVVALVDMAYVPLLAFMALKPLVQAKMWRNMVFLPILGTFAIANLLVHLRHDMMGVYLGLTVVMVMITVIGGRIIPSFTQTWLRMQGRPVVLAPVAWIERGGTMAATALAGLLTTFAPQWWGTGIVLLAAALIHGLRLSRWHGAKTVSNPILWVLHLGYLWLVVGLALMGGAIISGVLPLSAAIHAVSAGSVGTMILAVMSRASLGHSGRPLTVGAPVVAAYVLTSVGAMLRVAAPMLPESQMALTHAGGGLWALAWVLFVVVYFPIVTGPRADGRPG